MLRRGGDEPLPGPPPYVGEFASRWVVRDDG
jgi:hypothetical protein